MRICRDCFLIGGFCQINGILAETWYVSIAGEQVKKHAKTSSMWYRTSYLAFMLRTALFPITLLKFHADVPYLEVTMS